MENLTSYYRNLCEQLQQQIELVEKKIAEKKKTKKKLPPKGKKKGEEEKADKDYDGDGKVESGKAEYFGSKDKAIKKAMAKKKAQQMNEGRNIQSGQFLYGGFPRILNENGVTTQFNDADDTNPNDEQIATVPDADTGSAGYEKLRDIAYNMQSAMLSKKIPLNSEALKKAFDAIQAHPYHKTAAANSAATERIMRAGGMGVD